MPRGGRPPYSLAGTVPGDHGLDLVADQLRKHPRDEVWAVVKFHNSFHGAGHPIDGEDEPSITITILTLDPVTIPDDINTLNEIRDRARQPRDRQEEMSYPQGSDPGPPPEGGQSLTPDELAQRREAK